MLKTIIRLCFKTKCTKMYFFTPITDRGGDRDVIT